ncbi:MAG: FAD-binding oxidoreductase [Xanthomonadales bacterium]|nr:FAD-binding oxidoreductase [Xanthomonadales bacterium]
MPGPSLWERTAAPGPKLEPLASARKANVAVVGAGLAGLSTALHLAEKGLSVTVVEADEVGSGATGKSGGLLAPDMISHSPSDIERLFGSERGSRLLRMVGSSASQCFELIKKYDLGCDAEQTGFWTPAHNAAVASALQSRAHEWQARGFNVHYAESGETAACLGTDRYLGAIRFDDGGTVDPLALSRGLAATAQRFGAEIYAQSPVTSLRRHGSGWRVETDHGRVEAERVVLAANGGNPALHPALRHTVLPLDVVEFATAPLSEAQRMSILRHRISFTDKRAYIFTARYDAAGRLVSAFPNFMVKRSGAALFAEAARRIEQFYPALKGLPIEYLWHGRAWINPALLPSVHDLGDGAFAIQACNGRGITTNVVLGMELAAALKQRDPACLSVVPGAPVPIRAHRLARYAPSALMLLAFLRSRLFRPANPHN